MLNNLCNPLVIHCSTLGKAVISEDVTRKDNHDLIRPSVARAVLHTALYKNK